MERLQGAVVDPRQKDRGCRQYLHAQKITDHLVAAAGFCDKLPVRFIIHFSLLEDEPLWHVATPAAAAAPLWRLKANFPSVIFEGISLGYFIIVL